jgi:hypothetical protein
MGEGQRHGLDWPVWLGNYRTGLVALMAKPKRGGTKDMRLKRNRKLRGRKKRN